MCLTFLWFTLFLGCCFCLEPRWPSILTMAPMCNSAAHALQIAIYCMDNKHFQLTSAPRHSFRLFVQLYLTYLFTSSSPHLSGVFYLQTDRWHNCGDHNNKVAAAAVCSTSVHCVRSFNLTRLTHFFWSRKSIQSSVAFKCGLNKSGVDLFICLCWLMLVVVVYERG